MKAILLSIAVLAQIFCTNNAFAGIQDSTTSKYRYRLGIDILKPLATFLRANDGVSKGSYRIKFEFLTAYQITKAFSANLDLGYGKGVEYALKRAQRYESEGIYIKPGIEYNILSEEEMNTSNVSFSLGYRLGLCSFKENNQFLFHSNFWNSDYIEENNWKSYAIWHEIIAPARIILFRTEKQAFSMGITPRLRIKPQKSEHTQLFIPGYGGNDPFNIAINFDFAIQF